MIILLVSYGIDHSVNMKIFYSLDGRTYVLSHVNRGTVTSKHDLLIKSVGSKINPHAAVILTIKNTFFKTFGNHIFSKEIGVAFVIILVEIHPELLISLLEPIIHPLVHGLP